MTKFNSGVFTFRSFSMHKENSFLELETYFAVPLNENMHFTDF